MMAAANAVPNACFDDPDMPDPLPVLLGHISHKAFVLALKAQSRFEEKPSKYKIEYYDYLKQFCLKCRNSAFE
jgi:hypothetical protein